MTFLLVGFFLPLSFCLPFSPSLICESVGKCRRPVKSDSPFRVRAQGSLGRWLPPARGHERGSLCDSQLSRETAKTNCLRLNDLPLFSCAPGGSGFERAEPYCGMKIILFSASPDPRRPATPLKAARVPPLQADQSNVVFFPRARLSRCCFSGKLICHWPDTQLLDRCLKTFKTLWREVIHWIKKAGGGKKKIIIKKILSAGAQESIKLHFCGSGASSVTWPVSLDPSCEVLVYF